MIPSPRELCAPERSEWSWERLGEGRVGSLLRVEIEGQVVVVTARTLGKDWFKNGYNYLVMLGKK